MSRIRADQLVNRAGSGGPKFPHGVAEGFSVSGVVTATSFAGNLTGNADTATTATNAQGITGTPNITVGTIGCGNVTSTGDVTGVNATFSGNLTVQGTTTTIDTAVTSVDSLQIDGSLKVGTTQDSSFPDRLISVGSTIRTSSYLDIRCTTTGALLFADGLSGDSAYRGQVEYRHNDDSMRLWTAAAERLRILADGTITTGGVSATPGTVAAGSIIQASANSGFFTNGYDGKFGTSSNHPVYIQVNGSSKLTIATNGDLTSTGVISDSIGPLRRLGIQGASGGFSLAADMAGKLIRSTGNGSTLTIPQNVFSAGDMISIFNVSTGDNTIAQGTGTTLYNTADGATGNRTLAAKGVCTIVCTSTNEFIISGSQVS